MTIVDEDRHVHDADDPPTQSRGLLAFTTSTDHKRIGIAYMVTAFAFFLVGGALAGIIRAQLFNSDSGLVSENTFLSLYDAASDSCTGPPPNP